MGTNTPHTCIPGLVWQKQARRFSQFEFKVGELRFPIHFVCVSAALYHRGVRGRHFPLRWIWPIDWITLENAHTLSALSHTKYPYREYAWALFHTEASPYEAATNSTESFVSRQKKSSTEWRARSKTEVGGRSSGLFFHTSWSKSAWEGHGLSSPFSLAWMPALRLQDLLQDPDLLLPPKVVVMQVSSCL